MSHIFRVPDNIYSEIASYAARRGQTPDALLMTLVTEGVEHLKQTEPMAAVHKTTYDPTHDPLSPFIGAFESNSEDHDWIERHDEYFAGKGESKEHNGNKN